MLHIRPAIKSSLVSITAFLFVFALPLASLGTAHAEDCVPPDPTDTGIHRPTGSEAGTYTYQCEGEYQGQWLNAYYVFNPATNGRTALYSPDYQYDCETQVWTMTRWDYSPADSQYHQSRVVVDQPPGYSTNCPVIEPNSQQTSSTPNTSNGTNENSDNLGANTLSNNSVVGPSSDNPVIVTAHNSTVVGNTVLISADTAVSSNAKTGNAWVVGNTAAGNATSGIALDMATVVNMLQSSSNTLGTGTPIATFTANINGDVTGDLFLDPSLIGKIQPAGSTTNLDNNLVVNNSTDATLNNTITLDAASGNAGVNGNTKAGNATSGNAEAVANIVNMINSAITSGQSFIGTININGNLNGDILLPADFVEQLLAANTPTVTITVPNSTNSENTTVTNNATVNNTNNLGINNDVNLAAASGNADVSGNTIAGNATTGKASTNITAFNLTGSKVIGSNAILVFVNVMGKWVGVIVNAPAGTTAASLGGGITQNTTATNNQEINNTANLAINNNIDVNAQSGNAAVTGNTTAGNAKTGDARAAVNLLNVENSTLSLAGWFGILFINVFGTWNGSFGVNTSAGDPVVATSNTGTPSVAGTSNAVSLPAQVFRFVPRLDTTGTTTSGTTGSFTAEAIPEPSGKVLSVSTKKVPTLTSPQPATTHSNAARNYAIIGGLVVIYILGDAFVTRRFQHRVTPV